ncbi:acyl carrier protein [Janthinobacterium sp. BJB1]|uniref:acyl carrier protein n=1 Tax=Janthinobacterium sp. GW458P TaxID=1981504 RepID=UPI000A321BC1|nr:acyl carrier protein [Janthinobacterium sp. GW458P]MBE3024208.1 acyl carrier protein [Janthinobacterium sp. GW458P]PHV14279.1 acyl carrier protein [Janthinobacterium sp. BJB303]PJC96180.1 acyl carrier protein [Janthinobacterium sp. BJB1]
MQEFFNGMADILEIDADKVVPGLKLGDYAWDSLAIISTIALADELFDQMLEGQALANCETLADVLALIAVKV